MEGVMSAGGNPNNIELGPGRLYVAAVGTAAPTSASAAMPSAWWALGYTEEGTTVDIDITRDPIEVAEELDPVDYANSARAVKFSMALAEMTKKRLAVALALGSGYTDDGAYLDFPAADAVSVGVALVWDSSEDPTDGLNRRWYTPKVLPSGTISIERKKSPAKSTLPLELNAVKVSGSPIVRVFPNASGLI
jgi:hypothetical protein